MFLKRMFYASASILCLAVAYHLGARNAGAQAPGNAIVTALSVGCPTYTYTVVTANGDVYGSIDCNSPWVRLSNVFASGPTAAPTKTLGQIKVEHR